MHLLGGMGGQLGRELLTERFRWQKEQAREFILTAIELRHFPPTPFWSRFDDHQFSDPFSIALDVWRNFVSFLQLHPFRHILDGDPPSTWKLRTDAGPSHVDLQVRGANSLVKWRDLDYSGLRLMDCHPDWRVCEAVSAFARCPTKLVLEQQLEFIRTIDPAAEIATMRAHFPWQIAVCLQARRNGHDWESILAAVRNGSIGGDADWERWEELKQTGVKLSDCCTAGDMTVSDHALGPLLQEMVWSLGDESSAHGWSW